MINKYKKIKLSDNTKGYLVKDQLSNKQQIFCFFEEEIDFFSNTYEYCVFLGIANKKKDLIKYINGKSNLDDYITGKCGVEGLLWAKKNILNFEKFIKEHKFGGNVSRIVGWADARRKKIYMRSLLPNGYKLVNKYGWCLCKELSKQNR